MSPDRPAEFIFEFKRKMFHFLLGTAIAYILYFLYPIYGNLLLVPLIISILAMWMTPCIPVDHIISRHLLYHFEREKDKKEFPYKGAIFFGIGIIPPIVLLPLDAATGRPLLACAVIAVLAGGDAFATLVGKFYGRYRIRHKSIEGFIAFIIFSYAILMASPFVNREEAIVLALLGAIIEFFNTIDDNLAIPIGLTIMIEMVRAVAPGMLF
jgi:dolichol kinase